MNKIIKSQIQEQTAIGKDLDNQIQDAKEVLNLLEIMNEESAINEKVSF